MIKKILKKLTNYLHSGKPKNLESPLQENENEYCKEKLSENQPCRSDRLYNSNEYDQVVSLKFKKLITDIINICGDIEGVKISVNDSDMNIHIDDLSKIKTNSNSNKCDYCEIFILKNYGFTMRTNDDISTSYQDENIFNDIYPIASNYIKVKNSKNFEEIYSKCTLNTIIMRNNNLDSLLNDN